MLGIDFIGSIIAATTPFGYRYIVIAVDYCSQFLFAAPVTNPTGESVVRVLLEQVVCPFGWPGSLSSDNRQHCISGVFAHLLHDN